MSGPQIARELRRNHDTDIRVAFADPARDFIRTGRLPDNAKRFRVHKTIDELPALDRAIFIVNDRRHVLHVGVERVAERDHFHERREKHEEQRHRIARDADELLEQDGRETAERVKLHAAFFASFSPAYFAVSVTKTSSSDGPIS